MSDFSIRYRAAISPIETVTLADGSTEKRFVHSNLDTIYGSAKEKSVGSTSSKVASVTADIEFGSPRTLNDITSLTLTSVSFLYVKTVGSCDIDVKLSGTTISRLIGSGDFVIMKPQNAAGSALSFSNPNSVTTTSSIQVVYGLFDSSIGGGS